MPGVKSSYYFPWAVFFLSEKKVAKMAKKIIIIFFKRGKKLGRGKENILKEGSVENIC